MVVAAEEETVATAVAVARAVLAAAAWAAQVACNTNKKGFEKFEAFFV